MSTSIPVHLRNLSSSTTLSQGALLEHDPHSQTSPPIGSDHIQSPSPLDPSPISAVLPKTILEKRSKSTLAPILPQSLIPNAMPEFASSRIALSQSPPQARPPQPFASAWSCRWFMTRSPPIQTRLGSHNSASSYRGTCPRRPQFTLPLTVFQENTIKSRTGFPISVRRMLETHVKVHNLLPLLI